MKEKKIEIFCSCLEFMFWYVDTGKNDDQPPIDVCKCGHLATDHIDKIGTCIGMVIIR